MLRFGKDAALSESEVDEVGIPSSLCSQGKQGDRRRTLAILLQV